MIDRNKLLAIVSYFYDFSYEAFDYLLEDMYGDKEYVHAILDIRPTYVILENEHTPDKSILLGETYGSLIVLYLENIINNHLFLIADMPEYDWDDLLKTAIVAVLVHEFFHLNQNLVDTKTYESLINKESYFKNEDEYYIALEEPVVHKTYKYLTKNKNKISKALDFKYCDIIKKSISDSPYIESSKDMYWVNTLQYFTGCNPKINNIVYNEIQSHDNIIINVHIMDGPMSNVSYYLKKDGQILNPSEDLLKLLSRYWHGYTSSAITARDWLDNGVFKGRVLEIELKLDLIKPIERI